MQIAPHNAAARFLTAAAVQMAACLTNHAILEVFPYRPAIHYDIVENAFERQIKNGQIIVPALPGLGVTLNHQVVDRFCTAHLQIE